MAHNSELPIDPNNVPTGELFTKAHATYLHAQALVKEGHAESLDTLPATVHADIEGARASLLVCADRGHAKASFILAEMAEEGCGEERNDKKALELYERAALQGDSDAQLAYADKLEEGEGLESPDYERAFIFYERAALNGLVEAQNSLGTCYHHGHGTDQDFVRAFFWYEKAALAGDVDGAFHLAVAFEEGEGTSKVGSGGHRWSTR